MHITSIQVGRPRTVGVRGAEDPMQRAFTSAIWKEPVAGPVRVGQLGLAGDAVGNTRVHGGPDQAVLMYAASHYPRWAHEWRRELAPGAFGENLTVDGLTEDDVRIGDVFEVGTTVLQVSQPRQPCATLARRHQVPDLIALVQRNGRSGWYLRVLQEGEVDTRQPIRLVRRVNPDWTVRRAAEVMRGRHARAAESTELGRCEGLSAGWRARLGGGAGPER